MASSREEVAGMSTWAENHVRVLANSFGGGSVGPNGVATVVLEGGADVPAFDGVRCPCFADGGWFVDEDSCAGWCERRSIEVEGAVDLRPGGELGVDAGRAEEVERKECLWK